MAEATGWPEYLHHAGPALKVLQDQGLTRGEAVLALELNTLQRKTEELRDSMNEIARAFDRFAEALSRPNKEGEGWKDL